ncbi:uncharacterized protein KY384_001311 [Bacidia gigantensis]|uniref:uncharacterized protein n=1 Tax=Bacidia gigantensis TaxID=2732470 RepID=UPI001D03C182|nr:uncharacterized protein KY384_001311 [Bacidia gigantensis]KAG8533571.1 hypothetical protein KY384_001311 [Bacidia gigantensis]
MAATSLATSFISLPLELRTLIYTYIFPSPTIPIILSDDTSNHDLGDYGGILHDSASTKAIVDDARAAYFGPYRYIVQNSRWVFPYTICSRGKDGQGVDVVDIADIDARRYVCKVDFHVAAPSVDDNGMASFRARLELLRRYPRLEDLTLYVESDKAWKDSLSKKSALRCLSIVKKMLEKLEMAEYAVVFRVKAKQGGRIYGPDICDTLGDLEGLVKNLWHWRSTTEILADQEVRDGFERWWEKGVLL